MLFEALATLCAGLFAGAAIYITLVEHPARLECGTELAATEFGPSYRRATLMQASLAAVGLVAAVVAWIQGRGLLVLLGGLLLGVVIPFTLLVIRPTNERLLTLISTGARARLRRSWCGGAGFTLPAAWRAHSRSECCSGIWRDKPEACPAHTSRSLREKVRAFTASLFDRDVLSGEIAAHSLHLVEEDR